MPRRPRIFVEGGIYHVYNKFARGAGVLREGEEAERFLALLRQTRDRDGPTIFAWALMSNHYHLALRSGTYTPMLIQMRFEELRSYVEKNAKDLARISRGMEYVAGEQLHRLNFLLQIWSPDAYLEAEDQSPYWH